MSEAAKQTSSKRRSSSIHRSELKRRRAEQGVFMTKSPHLSNESKDLCENLLGENHIFISCTGYPERELFSVLERVQWLNKTRVQRDVMPRVVPPAEILHFHGEPGLSLISEDLNALWCYCEPKGGYTAGLAPEAFTAEETRKLQNYSSTKRPFLFTPDICFPFLTCEAKSGDQAMSRAQSQNINNGSIAVNAIIKLYQAAFEESEPHLVKELHGKVLAFSVSHDHDSVRIWGHYAVMQDGLKYYYHDIEQFSLTIRDGRYKNIGYHFVRNVYDKICPRAPEENQARRGKVP